VTVCVVSLTIMAVGTSTAGAERPHNASTSFSCVDRLSGRQVFPAPVAVTGNTPTSIQTPEAQVSMSDVQAAITIPGSALDRPIKKGAMTLTATVKAFDINASDARVKTMNVTNTPVTVGPFTLVMGQPTGTMTFTTGKAVILLDFGSPGSTTAQCTPKPAAVISTTTVT
jgi:hypothetical protein